MKIHKKILKITHDLQEIPLGKSKHFSFLVDKNKIVSIGWNRTKTHTLAHKMGYTWKYIHSELDCIIKFPYKPEDLSGYIMFNTRIDRNQQIKIAKPCRFCQRTLNHFGIKTIYTNNEGEFCD